MIGHGGGRVPGRGCGHGEDDWLGSGRAVGILDAKSISGRRRNIDQCKGLARGSRNHHIIGRPLVCKRQGALSAHRENRGSARQQCLRGRLADDRGRAGVGAIKEFGIVHLNVALAQSGAINCEFIHIAGQLVGRRTGAGTTDPSRGSRRRTEGGLYFCPEILAVPISGHIGAVVKHEGHMGQFANQSARNGPAKAGRCVVQIGKVVTVRSGTEGVVATITIADIIHFREDDRGARGGLAEVNQGFDRAGAARKLIRRVVGNLHIPIGIERERTRSEAGVRLAVEGRPELESAVVSGVLGIAQGRAGIAIDREIGQ